MAIVLVDSGFSFRQRHLLPYVYPGEVESSDSVLSPSPVLVARRSRFRFEGVFVTDFVGFSYPPLCIRSNALRSLFCSGERQRLDHWNGKWNGIWADQGSVPVSTGNGSMTSQY